jgi:tetratricopeptide (TPR) repeat protein
MTGSSRLDSLLLEWQARRARGEPCPAEELCAGCPELAEPLRRRIRDLESMEAFLGAGAGRTAGPLDPDLTPTLSTLDTAAGWPHVPGYEILGELGRGGMGVVYQARHAALDRVVALKVLLAGAHAGPDEHARLRAEAGAAARLSHPHIVQVHDVGEHEGRPYIALEYVAGSSLAQRLGGTPLPAREAARLVETLARAMQAAHEAHVIHRDLKPGNVLLAEDGTPKVADFGLARRVEGAARLTATGVIVGTPAYMAPEQARGQKEIGPAADVYALGAILYECLTGRPPFLGASPAETLIQVLEQEPVSPRRLNAKVPRDLDTITLKCLGKEPGRRYGSAGDLAADLKRWQTNEPILARPVGALERLSKWARRRPAAAGLFAALPAVLVVSFGMLYNLWRADRARGEAEEARARTQAIAASLTGRVEDPFGLNGGVYPISSEVGRRITFQDVLRRAEQKATQQLEKSPDVQASVYAVIGSSYRTLGLYEKAESHLNRALAHWESQGSKRDLDRAAVLHLLALVHHERARLDRDDYNRAENCYTEAQRIYRRAGSELALETRLMLAWLFLIQEEYDKAKEHFDGIVNGYDASGKKAKKPDRLYYRAQIGLETIKAETAAVAEGFTPQSVASMLGPMNGMLAVEPDKDWSDILDDFRSGAILMAGLGTLNGKDTAKARETRGRAEKCLVECAKKIENLEGTKWHFYRALPLFGLGESMADGGDPYKGAEKCGEALDVVRKTVGLAHDKAPYMMDRYARILYRARRSEDAHKGFAEVVKAFEVRFGRGHYYYANALMSYASFLREIRAFTWMGQVCEEALAVYDKTGREKRKLYKLCQSYLAEARAARRAE